MRALNISLFVVTFIVLLNFFATFQDMNAYQVNQAVSTANQTVSTTNISSDFQSQTNQMFLDMKTISSDSSLIDKFGAAFQIFQFGLALIFKSLFYALMIVPLLLQFGVPLAVASIIQIFVWILYVLSFFELRGAA